MTVNELLTQLQTLKELGYGNNEVIYLDENDISHDFESGVHDIYDKKTIVLG